MLSLRFSVSLLLGGVLLCNAASLLAQAYPTRPVRIVTAGIGGGNDFVARLIAQGISGPLGQPVIVDNRPGASSIPGTVVAQSQPDGHTILIYGAGVWLSQFLRDDVTYDVERDFAPVTMLDGSPLLLVVHPSMPVNSVKDLIAYAKAKPGALNFSTGGTGSSSHLSAELFMYMTGTKMVRIPYASGSQEILDLVGGQVQLTFSTGAAAPHVKSGKLRALAHTGDQPSTLYPGVPTVASAVPGYRAGAVTGMFVPAKTPAAVIKRLNEETVRYLKTPEAKERLFGAGTEPIGNSPEEARATVRTEVARWGKVIKELGIKTN
jgi:tripartite-type tricarboxylate transporter receptor subunit TctC